MLYGSKSPGKKPPTATSGPVLVEVFVAAVEETHDVLRFVGESEQLFAHGIRHGLVFDAVQISTAAL